MTHLPLFSRPTKIILNFKFRQRKIWNRAFEAFFSFYYCDISWDRKFRNRCRFLLLFRGFYSFRKTVEITTMFSLITQHSCLQTSSYSWILILARIINVISFHNLQVSRHRLIFTVYQGNDFEWRLEIVQRKRVVENSRGK